MLCISRHVTLLYRVMGAIVVGRCYGNAGWVARFPPASSGYHSRTTSFAKLRVRDVREDADGDGAACPPCRR